MSIHLEREIERLKRSILSLSALVEENVEIAVRAFSKRDAALAATLKKRDSEVDEREVEVEEECLKILALHQPVAIDLRFIVSTLKINSDLERISDLAASIANKAATLARYPSLAIPMDLAPMATLAQSMLHDTLDAFVNLNSELAASVCARDDEVDALKREARKRTETLVQETPEHVRPYYSFLGAARNLERIGDHATNIAEDVIYMVDAKIVRHSIDVEED